MRLGSFATWRSSSRGSASPAVPSRGPASQTSPSRRSSPRQSSSRALFLAPALALLALTFAAASWTPAAAAETGADDPVILRIGWMEDPDNLNPFVGLQATSYEIWHLNYDYLVGIDAKTREPRPELATEWDVSADGTTWTFTMRKGATWQDGEPVTAADAAFTLNFIVENQVSNLTVYTEGIERAEAVGTHVLKVYTSRPKADMLSMPIPILPEHIWGKLDPEKAASTFANGTPIVGSGPFQVVEWKKGRYVRLVANTDYWRGRAKVDEIIFATYKNADTMTSDLKIGNIDGCVGIPNAQFASVGEVEGVTANEGTSWELTNIGMNCCDSPYSKGSPVLLDPAFRQALNWAVDREKVVEQAFLDYAKVGSSLIVPYSPYHWEPAADEAYTYDPAKAKQLLEDAGYRDEDGDGYRETKDGEPLSLRFQATSDAPENTVIAKLCVGWFKEIGVKTVLSVVDAGVLIDAQYNYEGDHFAPDYDLFIWYWTQTDDPNFMLGVFTPSQIEGWNEVCWTDPQYTKLNEEQTSELDEDRRIELAREQQKIFYESAAYIIPSYPSQLEAYDSASWAGWVKSPAKVGAVLLDPVCVDTYLSVRPAAATAEEGSLSAGAIAGIVIACVVVLVIALVFFLMLRGRRNRPADEE